MKIIKIYQCFQKNRKKNKNKNNNTNNNYKNIFNYNNKKKK